MASGKLLKFGVPIAKQVSPTGVGVNVTAASVRNQTGQCGIDPFKLPPPPPPAIPEKFPDHLIRPPCLPGSERGRFPPECQGLSGFYCPPERAKYKYPPFSENINFIPSGQEDCWWAKPRVCEVNDDDEQLPVKL